MLARNRAANGIEHGYRHGQVERAARLNDARRRESRLMRALEQDARMQRESDADVRGPLQVFLPDCRTVNANDEQENAHV